MKTRNRNTTRSRIFTHLVCRGMDRAYKAAAIISAEYPEARLALVLREDVENFLPDQFWGDLMDLPMVSFVHQGVALEEAPALSLGSTTEFMVASLREHFGDAIKDDCDGED